MEKIIITLKVFSFAGNNCFSIENVSVRNIYKSIFEKSVFSSLYLKEKKDDKITLELFRDNELVSKGDFSILEGRGNTCFDHGERFTYFSPEKNIEEYFSSQNFLHEASLASEKFKGGDVIQLTFTPITEKFAPTDFEKIVEEYKEESDKKIKSGEPTTYKCSCGGTLCKETISVSSGPVVLGSKNYGTSLVFYFCLECGTMKKFIPGFI